MALRLNGATSGFVALNAPDEAGSNTLTLPTGNGTTGQYLQTSGASGVLSWQTVTSTEYQGPAFYAYRSADQSISNGTWVKYQGNEIRFNVDSDYDGSTNYRFTPQKAGYYIVQGSAFLNFTSGVCYCTGMAIYKNGSRYSGGRTCGAANQSGTRNVSTLVYLNGTTDYVELYGYSDGGNASFYRGGDSENAGFFCAAWVHE